MNPRFSLQLTEDLNETLQSALRNYGIVNVPVLAEQIRQRNEAENVALEDIAEHLLTKAQALSAAMIFDSPQLN